MEAPEQRSAETAARHLVRRVPRARARDRAGAVLAGLAGGDYDAVDAVYVVDEDGRLQGLVRLRDLFVLPAERPLGEAMDARPPHVRPDEDQERVAVLAIRHRVAAVPVVDEGGRLLGVVPAQALIEILRREHVEDLHRLAGIRRENDQARNAMEAPPARRARDRLPWLLVGLLGSMIATLVVSRFERVLEAYVAVAFFVPGIVYLADAIGTQTEAIAVRGLSLSHAPLRRLLGGELRTGLLIGLGLGALIFPSVLLAFGDLRLAVSVALGVLVAGAAATTIGLLLPWLLSRAGKDPAFGSGPVATIIQDVLSLLVYFTIVSLLLI
ncbi:MAG: magnesium transporter [Pseudomonadota bacterium]|uniref:magnesium transporter n=1 Tax=Thermithiobacillus tepidarius TaxID=929 RepID=UPI000411BFFC|nr:magnesium transporter [Thermithiobacillus tepidarius]